MLGVARSANQARPAILRPSHVVCYFAEAWQFIRMPQAYVLTGQLSDSRSLVLDEAVPLSDGRVTVQAMIPKEVRRPHSEVIEEIWARQRQRGHIPPTADEVNARIEEERNSWV